MVSSYSGRQGGNGAVMFVAGLVVGAVLCYGGQKAYHHFNHSNPAKTEKSVAVVKEPAAGAMIQFTAEQQRRGMEVASATQAVKLMQNGDSKLARQDDDKVFLGFKSLNSTASYLKSGQGEIVVKTSAGQAIDTGWKAPDYDEFLKGGALQVRALPGQALTVFFQRKGHGPINLGTITVSGAAHSAKPDAPKSAAGQNPAAGEKPAQPEGALSTE